jgi:hypothetical protein
MADETGWEASTCTCPLWLSIGSENVQCTGCKCKRNLHESPTNLNSSDKPKTPIPMWKNCVLQLLIWQHLQSGKITYNMVSMRTTYKSQKEKCVPSDAKVVTSTFHD